MLAALKVAFSPCRNWRYLTQRPENHVPTVDAFRAISMLLIFVFHCFFSMQEMVPASYYYRFYEGTPDFLAWIWGGDRGVDIFFVISGFLIGGMLFKEYDLSSTINFKRFYWRRFMRLAPVYIFAMLIYYLAKADNTHNLWANLLYVNNFLGVLDMAMMWCWSLAVEEQFYLLFPLMLFGFYRLGWSVFAWCFGLFFLSFFIRAIILLTDDKLLQVETWQYFFDDPVFRHYFEVLYDNLYTRFGSLICGVFGAYLYLYHTAAVKRFFERRLGRVLSLLAFAVVLLSFVSAGYLYLRDLDWAEAGVMRSVYLITHRNIFSVAILILILGSIFPSGFFLSGLSRFFQARFWYPLAQLSYSMYIFHLFAIFVLFKTYTNRDDYHSIATGDYYFGEFAWLSLASFVVSLLFAVIVYLFLERPCMSLRSIKKLSESTR